MEMQRLMHVVMVIQAGSAELDVLNNVIIIILNFKER